MRLTASPYPAIIFCMSLKQKLQDDLKVAMKAGNKRKLAALRLTLASIKIAETAETRATRGDLTDEEVTALLQTEVKRRRDTIAELEKVELEALMEYLPRQLTRDQVVEAARAVVGATGATGQAQTSVVMKQLMAQLKGQADGKVVSDIVRELLSK